MQCNVNVAELMNEGFKQTYESAEARVKTNYYGNKGVSEALLPCLLLSNSGKIVNLSSSLGMLQVCMCNCTFRGKFNFKTKFKVYNALEISSISINNKSNAESLPYFILVTNERVRIELNDVDELSVERLDEIANGYLKDVKEEKLHDKGWPTYTSAYTISKAAMNAYTRITAKSNPSLLINCICPGFIKTDMTSDAGFFTVDVGARGPVMLALLPEEEPSGLFSQQMQASTTF